MSPGHQELDERTIRELARRLTEAEAAGDAAFMAQIIAADVVIMPPGIEAMVGAEACLDFIRHVLHEVGEEFDRRLEHVTAEVIVNGDVAVERGSFSQTLTPKSGGDQIHERGQYLRMFARDHAGSWKLARVIWNDIAAPEEAC